MDLALIARDRALVLHTRYHSESLRSCPVAATSRKENAYDACYNLANIDWKFAERGGIVASVIVVSILFREFSPKQTPKNVKEGKDLGKRLETFRRHTYVTFSRLRHDRVSSLFLLLSEFLVESASLTLNLL
ncbi:hypothetical protein E2986_13605 [Frieseomelitta varia]|uniref:Uncharacterized protein n=1 Tax=Frieseomelitta varia TaxID=561572 RepID=A0A833RTH6_9HYME|nr:hypothetical protein E2986_13605 [Frieseomelitta varia]